MDQSPFIRLIFNGFDKTEKASCDHLKEIEQLLMNKYVITENDREFIFSNYLGYMHTPLYNMLQDFSYPITQEEFNEYYKSIPTRYVLELDYSLKQLEHYLIEYIGKGVGGLGVSVEHMSYILKKNKEKIQYIDKNIIASVNKTSREPPLWDTLISYLLKW